MHCTRCGTYSILKDGGPCYVCDRWRDIAVLVSIAVALRDRVPDLIGDLLSETDARDTRVWLMIACDTLDAIAGIMIERAKTRRQHNKELRDEQLGAQRDARAAYDEGKWDGQRSSEDW